VTSNNLRSMAITYKRNSSHFYRQLARDLCLGYLNWHN